jgi:DNA-binding GntR family transcriptional regulator
MNNGIAAFADISQHESLTEKVRKLIEEAIINNELGPGERLKELDLVERFKISRGPVREAFRTLETEGLILSQPRRGYVVAPLNVKEAMDIFEVRPWLEGQATRLAAKNRDENFIAEIQGIVDKMRAAAEAGDTRAYIRLDAAFHRTIYRNANNLILIDMMDNLWKKCLRYIVVTDTLRGEISSSFQRHRDLFLAIRDESPARAQQIAESNLKTAKVSLLAGLQAAGIR